MISQHKFLKTKTVLREKKVQIRSFNEVLTVNEVNLKRKQKRGHIVEFGPWRKIKTTIRQRVISSCGLLIAVWLAGYKGFELWRKHILKAEKKKPNESRMIEKSGEKNV